MRPFNIPENLFVSALEARVPLTIAAVYAVTVKLLNKYNKAQGKKSWAISKTRLFSGFVVLHNIFLAVYSAWTFWGMVGVMNRTIASPFGPDGFAATADSLCRVHGPAGLGNSVYFNDTSASWDSASSASAAGLLEANGLPSSTQMGRMWNEGLAYYGWIFYLSKFYEVLDTFIILAKGKYSSTLQTYHHAGAMLCMWAGIRYMSVPIWVFCTFNSFIHALMYTYYTLSAFNVKVPMILKRSLTSMQITQFIVGASCAMVHSFITFLVPMTASPASAETGPTLASKVGSIIPAAGAVDSMKHVVFGGANGDSMPPVPSAIASRQSVGTGAAASSSAFLTQPCIATSSETFAIWLNVLYLAPLTYLFVSFFISSYVKRSNAASKLNGAPGPQQMSDLAEKAGWEAARNVEREVYGQDGTGSPKSRSPTRRAD
ncbi:Elongation of very long chain fatty acids protein 3 [Escovopsis weberi]|uniref:Elongation of fatty acids protein n=1 Tax=Escovopsis weberi TaxID=150374 RepID=A0A0M8N1C0_ESCWE|nr:Elongation of very long chain fatty acids protein 3 [Escovopsis weberi]